MLLETAIHVKKVGFFETLTQVPEVFFDVAVYFVSKLFNLGILSSLHTLIIR